MTVVEMVLELDHTLKFKVKIHSLPLSMLPGDDDDNSDNDYSDDRLPELVEWRGELYLLFQERHFSSTVGLYLYKLESKLKNLAKVESLGDGMILLLNGRPKCFYVNDFPPSLNLRGNCIYHIKFQMLVPVNASVFCLEDRKLEPFPILTFQHLPSMMWYIPKICS
ncbi:hypothetical protein AAC387_Pa03g0997 [Persea americana]